MLGDHNLLNVASNELKYRYTKDEKERRKCGYCITGLRISEAIELVKKMDKKIRKVVINVGATDIAEGKTMGDIIRMYKELLQACKDKGIQAVPTTIPPIANCLHDGRKQIAKGLNTFIRRTVALRCPIIDLFQGMIDSSEAYEPKLYQYGPKHVKGANTPVVLWNRSGVRRIHQMLMTHLGFANIFSKNYVGTYYQIHRFQ